MALPELMKLMKRFLITVKQFQVPQFITVEDRIVGPLTLKQFFYLLGAAATGLTGWRLLPIWLFAPLALPVVGFFIAMAFLKINGRTFPTIFASAIAYYTRPRLYLWRNVGEEKKKPEPAAATRPEPPVLKIPTISESKLADLAWSLDIKERIGRR